MLAIICCNMLSHVTDNRVNGISSGLRGREMYRRNVRVSNLRSASSTYSHWSMKQLAALNRHLNEGEDKSSDLK